MGSTPVNCEGVHSDNIHHSLRPKSQVNYSMGRRIRAAWPRPPDSRLDWAPLWSDDCVDPGVVDVMQMETKFLRLRIPVTIGSRFGDWEVTWLGGWTRDRPSY